MISNIGFHLSRAHVDDQGTCHSGRCNSLIALPRNSYQHGNEPGTLISFIWLQQLAATDVCRSDVRSQKNQNSFLIAIEKVIYHEEINHRIQPRNVGNKSCVE